MTFIADDPRIFKRSKSDQTDCIEDGVIFQHTAKKYAGEK